MRYVIHRYPVLDSTNTTAHRLAREGAPEGTVVVAERQEQGRGRFGRSFFSPGDSGLYFSLILRPDHLSPDQALYLTTAAAVAVSRSAEALTGTPAAIKWVNDVYVQDRKVAGILTEGCVGDGRLQYAVLGVGVNLFTPTGGFPENIADRAGTLFCQPQSPAAREALLEHVLNTFDELYRVLPDISFLEEYRSRSFLTGRTVRLLTPDDTPGETVTVRGIDDDFGLLVEGPGGCRTIRSGDVSVKV